MKRQRRTVLGVVGVILTVIGLTGAIPLFVKDMFFGAGIASLFVVIGIILIAVAFSD